MKAAGSAADAYGREKLATHAARHDGTGASVCGEYSPCVVPATCVPHEPWLTVPEKDNISRPPRTIQPGHLRPRSVLPWLPRHDQARLLTAAGKSQPSDRFTKDLLRFILKLS